MRSLSLGEEQPTYQKLQSEFTAKVQQKYSQKNSNNSCISREKYNLIMKGKILNDKIMTMQDERNSNEIFQFREELSRIIKHPGFQKQWLQDVTYDENKRLVWNTSRKRGKLIVPMEDIYKTLLQVHERDDHQSVCYKLYNKANEKYYVQREICALWTKMQCLKCRKEVKIKKQRHDPKNKIHTSLKRSVSHEQVIQLDKDKLLENSVLIISLRDLKRQSPFINKNLAISLHYPSSFLSALIIDDINDDSLINTSIQLICDTREDVDGILFGTSNLPNSATNVLIKEVRYS